MPRALRIEYPGAVYHVMSRGDRREPIYLSDADRRAFLETLGEACERAGFIVHAYVLMTNHYHLLLETPGANLVSGMKWLQGTYTQRYNRANRLNGHVFQGRYKAIPVDADTPGYFRLASDYIHLNPARAGLLVRQNNDLSTFPWSSFPAFVKQRKLVWPWLRRIRVFASHELQDEAAGSRSRYAAYMERRVAELFAQSESPAREKQWRSLRRGWYSGSELFRDQLLERAESAVKGTRRDSYEKGGLQLHDEHAAQRRLDEALKRLGVAIENVWGRRQNDAVKQAVAWWVKHQTVVGDEWICRKLHMGSRMNVHRAVNRYRKESDPESQTLKKMLLCAD